MKSAAHSICQSPKRCLRIPIRRPNSIKMFKKSILEVAELQSGMAAGCVLYLLG